MSDEAPNNFHVLRERHRLIGKLRTCTALHIGTSTGYWDEASDLPILRDAIGRPFIPGSSLKGVIRSTVEALIRGAGNDRARLWACDPLAEKTGDEGACGYHESEGRLEAIARIKDHCTMCRIFGSRVLASHVRFSDALLDPASSARVEKRDGVAIDRDLRVVHGGQKYDFEVVAPGAEFTVEVFVDNPDRMAMGLVLLGFDQLHYGFSALGGFTSRGLGRVEMTWSELRTITAAELLKDPKEPPAITGDQLRATLERWRKDLTDAITNGSQSKGAR